MSSFRSLEYNITLFSNSDAGLRTCSPLNFFHVLNVVMEIHMCSDNQPKTAGFLWASGKQDQILLKCRYNYKKHSMESVKWEYHRDMSRVQTTTPSRQA